MNDELKIDHGIPMPILSCYGSRLAIIKLMKPGDSIFFKDRNKARSFIGGINLYFKKSGVASARKVDGGWRVWRVK